MGRHVEVYVQPHADDGVPGAGRAGGCVHEHAGELAASHLHVVGPLDLRLDLGHITRRRCRRERGSHVDAGQQASRGAKEYRHVERGAHPAKSKADRSGPVLPSAPRRRRRFLRARPKRPPARRGPWLKSCARLRRGVGLRRQWRAWRGWPRRSDHRPWRPLPPRWSMTSRTSRLIAESPGSMLRLRERRSATRPTASSNEHPALPAQVERDHERGAANAGGAVNEDAPAVLQQRVHGFEHVGDGVWKIARPVDQRHVHQTHVRLVGRVPVEVQDTVEAAQVRLRRGILRERDLFGDPVHRCRSVDAGRVNSSTRNRCRVCRDAQPLSGRGDPARRRQALAVGRRRSARCSRRLNGGCLSVIRKAEGRVLVRHQVPVSRDSDAPAVDSP